MIDGVPSDGYLQLQQQYDQQNQTIPMPGQPTNSWYTQQQQIPGQSGLMPGAAAGMWNGQQIPQTPQNSQPGWMRTGDISPHTSEMAPRNTRSLISGLMSQYMNGAMTSDQWRGLLPAGQSQQGQLAQGPGFSGGNYGNQAAQMAGVLPARNPNDTYPNGLLGGKRGGFRPGGK